MSRYRNTDVLIPGTDTRAGGGRSLQRILVPVGSTGQADQALAWRRSSAPGPAASYASSTYG